jgi:hypothetical protein
MPAHPRTGRSQWIRERRWSQTSFLDDAAAAGAENAPREIEDVLGVADRAADTTSRRDALDRLYGYLAQQAMQRGRKPVPKRSDPQGAP